MIQQTVGFSERISNILNCNLVNQDRSGIQYGTIQIFDVAKQIHSGFAFIAVNLIAWFKKHQPVFCDAQQLIQQNILLLSIRLKGVI